MGKSRHQPREASTLLNGAESLTLDILWLTLGFLCSHSGGGFSGVLKVGWCLDQDGPKVLSVMMEILHI